MLITAEEINKLINNAGNDVTNRGKKYFEQSRVKIAYFNYISDDNYIAKSYVEGTYIYEIEFKKQKGILSYKCECPGACKKLTPCKHVIAVAFNMYINQDDYINYSKNSKYGKFDDEVMQSKSYKDIKNEKIENDGLVAYYENLEMSSNLKDKRVKIEPMIELSNMDKDLEISFKIGTDKMYILHDIYKFAQAMRQGEKVKYGKNLEFIHSIDAFEEDSKNIAKYITKKISEYMEFTKLSTTQLTTPKRYKSYLKIKYGALDEFFDIMLNTKIQIFGYDYEKSYGAVTLINENPSIEIEMDSDEDGIKIIRDIQEYYIFDGQDYSYILYKDKLHRCSNDYLEKVIPVLREFITKKEEILKISNNNATSFCEYIVPNLRKYTRLSVKDELLDKFKAENLRVKVYLDTNSKADIISQVNFIYGDFEFNPFDKVAIIKCNRNKLKEAKAKNLFKKYKFMINFTKNIIYISNEEDIYNFLKEGVTEFTENFEVLVTDKLRNRKILNPRMLNMGVRIENDLLDVDLGELRFEENDLKEIFKKYKLKKKYYRLKSGDFINLDSPVVDTLVSIADNLDLSEKDIIDGKISVPKYRAVYFDNIINKEKIEIKKDDEFNELVDSINNVFETNFDVPKSLENVLRGYQKTGYNWLKTLSSFGLGGILADDMGLGKTIQVIALLLDEKKQSGQSSIVVCPSSLYINWQKEINRFAPQLDILVVSGTTSQRADLIKKCKSCDIVITSYDLLKRDIEEYKDITFKYVIADEAQYIKNNNTKNAKALKKIKGKNRFALTGTPIENSLSELWSIFDYIMPGYLFSYKKFKDEFETLIIKENDSSAMQRLQKLVAPFILRRIKKEVLKELPEKTETVLYSKMGEAQEKLYKVFLAKAKEEMKQEIEINGFEKSQMKILSLITRLRQICCHPSLFLDDYDLESSKLNQCIELVEEAIKSGHKILLFSQFTSMLNIIIEEFEKRDIIFSVLTGQTKADTRSAIVDEFNKNKEISVFLISLKAGGTGLNLTGADIVIHYDPWWNLSVQNQATDRAYRIGQRSNVQVFKLIVQNSIEEKIQSIQEKKMDLTNSIIQEGETFINKMSKEEIMDLFEM
ncbi:MAG: SNF2 helicase associated domain-containing protein [Clostridia bacterium]